MESTFTLNSEKIGFPGKFKKIGELSDSIFQQLNHNEHNYVIQSNVSLETFLLVKTYLIEGINPEIHIGNIFELHQLAYELGLEEIKAIIKSKWHEYEDQLDKNMLSQLKQQLDEKNIEIQKLNENIVLLKQQIENYQLEQTKKIDQIAQICLTKDQFRKSMDAGMNWYRDNNHWQYWPDIYNMLKNAKDAVPQ